MVQRHRGSRRRCRCRCRRGRCLLDKLEGRYSLAAFGCALARLRRVTELGGALDDELRESDLALDSRLQGLSPTPRRSSRSTRRRTRWWRSSRRSASRCWATSRQRPRAPRRRRSLHATAHLAHRRPKVLSTDRDETPLSSPCMIRVCLRRLCRPAAPRWRSPRSAALECVVALACAVHRRSCALTAHAMSHST